jgi:putative lipoprotein
MRPNTPKITFSTRPEGRVNQLILFLKMLARFPKIIFLLTLGVSLAIQISWANQECELSLVIHHPEPDTLMVSDKWIASDKLEHLGVSAFFSGVFYNMFHDFYNNDRESSKYLSATLTLSLGLGKEFYDKKTPQGRFSYKDFVADIAGIGLGWWIATR